MPGIADLVRRVSAFTFRKHPRLDAWIDDVFVREDAAFAKEFLSRWGECGPDVEDVVDIRPLLLGSREGFFANAELFFYDQPQSTDAFAAITAVFEPPTGEVVQCPSTARIYYRPWEGPHVLLASTFQDFLSQTGIDLRAQKGMDCPAEQRENERASSLLHPDDRSVADEFYSEWLRADDIRSIDLADDDCEGMHPLVRFLRDAAHFSFFCPPTKLAAGTWLIGGSAVHEVATLLYDRNSGQVRCSQHVISDVRKWRWTHEEAKLANSFRAFVEGIVELGWEPDAETR